MERSGTRKTRAERGVGGRKGRECTEPEVTVSYPRPSALITSMFVPVLRILTLMSFSERSDRRERREEDEMRR